jgi:hypothetical protein
VGAVSTCVSVTTRAAAGPRPRVAARRQPLRAPGQLGRSTPPHDRRKTNSPLGSRPAYPLSIARELPESGDDLLPAWRRAGSVAKARTARRGRARRSKGDTRDITSLRRREARRRARRRAGSPDSAGPRPQRPGVLGRAGRAEPVLGHRRRLPVGVPYHPRDSLKEVRLTTAIIRVGNIGSLLAQHLVGHGEVVVLAAKGPIACAGTRGRTPGSCL